MLVSDVALAVMIAGLWYFAYATSFFWLVKTYLIPYLIVNFWLVTITELQHTDQKLPHYNNDQWNWLKGALCTIDRDYGILNTVFHHIGDTHVLHHLFSKIPHYHAEEATKAVKTVLGRYYMKDTTPILRALYQSFVSCVYVEADEQKVLWFKSIEEIMKEKSKAQ